VVSSEAGIPVGSIAAGGRYDNLVGAFSTGKVPCVGVSIGIERVFAIMEQKASQSGGLKTTPVQVLLASAGKGLTLERMKVARELWAAYV
jgi:histidyl-tRNA synthetase